ncbi:uncharacterized mitochondrial protein-like protein [Tanacetum coccineum]
MLDNGTIDEYAAKLSGIASKSATLGEVMSEHKLVKKFLTSVPRCFVHIVAALKQVLDPKTMGTEYSNGNNNLNGGRGRDSYFRGHGRGRGQGCGHGNSQNHGQHDSLKNHEDNEKKGKQHEKRNLSHIQCYRCDQYEHFFSKCPEQNQNHEVKLNETQEKGMYNEEAGKGWKINHLDVKTDFLNGDRKKLDSTLKEMGFLQCVHEKAVYKAVINGEFIIVVVYVDDLFMTGTSLDCIRKDCVEAKQERYARKILKEAGMEDCNPALCPMELGLKLSKAKDKPEVEATQYRKMVSCLRYLLHTRPDLTYSVGVVSRLMQSLRTSHDRAIKQILRYLKGTTSFGIKYKQSNDMRLVGYISHNVDIDDGRSTTRHIFYLGTSPITWCSQKQTTVALSSCEAEFMAATAATCQGIWLREVLAKVTENEQVIVEHVSGENQRADMLTKALARIRFKDTRSLLGVQELPFSNQKFRG